MCYYKSISIVVIATFLLILQALLNQTVLATSDNYFNTNDNNRTSGHNEPLLALWLTQDAPKHVVGNEKLLNLLTRVGPDMKASSDYHDYHDIHANESILAWKLLHEQLEQFAQNQVHLYRPKLEKLLLDSSVSKSCKQSIDVLLDSLEHLNTWAVQMWSSTGSFPPTGLLDGQFSDLGSYRGCVDLEIPSNLTGYSSPPVNYTSFCIASFRPIVKSREPFHMIINSEDSHLVAQFNQTLLNFFANKAQYFNYLYMKTGVCVPSECSAEDIQQVANLVARRLFLMPGPVHCFTKAPPKEQAMNSSENEYRFNQIENMPILVEINKSMNLIQYISIMTIGIFFSSVFLSTVWHVAENIVKMVEKSTKTGEYSTEDGSFNFEDNQTISISNLETRKVDQVIEYGRLKHIAFEYLSLITNWNEFTLVPSRSTEIKCLHGLRVITMAWIIIVHSLQYNDWSGFSRVFENTATLKNILLQPIYNANYSVDNFFFMSGLLTAYTVWHSCKGTSFTFSFSTSLIGRYLRLTPQVLLVSLCYIILPLLGDSPFWFEVTNLPAKYCEKNWWVNLLHIQAFYREDEICNLVGWWLSVDMFYYILAIGIVYMILNNHLRRALTATTLLVATCLLITVIKHYNGHFTPNNLAVVPQVAEVWTQFVVDFFWSPYPHAYPFYSGLWVGYLLANNIWYKQVRRWSHLGWILATASLVTVSLSSHIWISGYLKPDNQYVSTFYNSLCTIVWSSAYGWLVMALHYGCGPKLNELLSAKPIVLLSKASFIIYLSHMLVVRSYYGIQNSLIEVSVLTIIYIAIGNIVLSSFLGIFLHVSFEGPCMKFQRFVTSNLKPRRPTPTNTAFVSKIPSVAQSTKAQEKLSVKSSATGTKLLKN